MEAPNYCSLAVTADPIVTVYMYCFLLPVELGVIKLCCHGNCYQNLTWVLLQSNLKAMATYTVHRAVWMCAISNNIFSRHRCDKE